MGKTFGYCRISTRKQNIDRQIRNILAYDPKAELYQEAYTGTKVQGRTEFNKLLKKVQSGDTIVFDSVSRMSRNAEQGIELYFDLYNKGVNLVFLKERHIDTDSYKKALASAGISIKTDGTAEGDLVQDITAAITRFMKAKASDDILKAFEQSQKEVDDLRTRTIEGLKTARDNGKHLGGIEGKTLTTKKSIEKKEIMKKHCIICGGSLNDVDCMKLTGLSRNTYYKYKRELEAEMIANATAE